MFTPSLWSALSRTAYVAVCLTSLACAKARPVDVASPRLAPSSSSPSCTLPQPDDSTLVGIEGDIEIAYREREVPRELMYDLGRKLASVVVWTPRPITGTIGSVSLRM